MMARRSRGMRGCGFGEGTFAGMSGDDEDAPIPAYSQTAIELLNPTLTRHLLGLRRRTVGTAETSYSHRSHPSTAIAGSVTVSSSANAVFGICLSRRMGVDLTCR
jgi:hypothetical protein